MKKAIASTLALVLLLTLCPAVFAADWSLPDGVPMYEPGCVMELDFGTFTVLEVGFAKEIVYLTDQTAGDPPRQIAGAFMAGDGSALLVLKGRLCNYSDNAVDTAKLEPTVWFGAEDSKVLHSFLSLALGQEDTTVVKADAEQDILFAANVPNTLYYGSMNLLFSLSGSSLGLDRYALKSYAELGFSGGAGPLGNHIGVLVEDATKPLSLGTSPTVPSDTAPHIDELTIEDAFMEYNPDAGYAYKCPLYVKMRFNIEIPPEHPLIECLINIQPLDRDGTALPTSGILSSDVLSYHDLQAGQAAWNTYDCAFNPEKAELVRSFKLSSYVLRMADTPSANLVVRGTFSDPIILSINDLMSGESPWLKAEEKEPAISIENVSVDYSETLPDSILNSSAFRSFSNAKKGLADSQVYAVIRFKATNLSRQDINLSDIRQFVGALDFDDGFVYSTSGYDVSAFESENGEISIHADNGRANSMMLAPLTAKEYTLYLTCPKVVRDQVGKPLKIFFTLGSDAEERYVFNIR